MRLVAENKNQIKSISDGPFSAYCKSDSDILTIHKTIDEEDKRCRFFSGRFFKSLGDIIFKNSDTISNFRRENTYSEFNTLRDRLVRSELSVNSFNDSRYNAHIKLCNRDYIV